MFNDVPDYLQFNAKVGMGENVAKSGNISPGYVRILSVELSQIGILEALADDFKISQNCILRFLVVKQAGRAISGVIDDSRTAIPCMCKINVRVFFAHRGMASERMRLAR